MVSWCLLVLWLLLSTCSAEQMIQEESIHLNDQWISFQLPEGFALTDASREGRWVYENAQEGITIEVDTTEEDPRSQKAIIEKIRNENIVEELVVNDYCFLLYRSPVFRNFCHAILLDEEGYSLRLWCFYPVGTKINEIPSELLQIIQSFHSCEEREDASASSLSLFGYA